LPQDIAAPRCIVWVKQ